jgi:hypothetical protein
MYEDKKDDQTNQELSVNETAPAYLGARPRAALLDVDVDEEAEAAPTRFVLSPDKYTCGVPDMDKMTDDELVAVIEEGLADIRAGRVYTSEEVKEELRKKFGFKLL